MDVNNFANQGINRNLIGDELDDMKSVHNDTQDRYQQLIENSPSGIIVHQEGKIVFANQEAINHLGANDCQLIGMPVLELVHPEDRAEAFKKIEEILSGIKGISFECRVICMDGREIFVETKATKIEFNGKDAIMLIEHDITERKRLEAKLKDNDQRYKSLFEHNANSVYSFDLNGYFTSCNSVFEELTGYCEEELKRMHYSDLIITDAKQPIDCFEFCKEGVPQNFRTSIHVKSGDLIQLFVTIVPMMVNGRVDGVFGISQDITSQVESERANEYMAFHDYLTNLPNRNMLNSRLSKELAIASETEQSIALLFIDIDRFKLINDNLGHTTGDNILKEIANRLRSSVHNSDIVFRQGGDEFIVILTESDRNVAAMVAERILEVLSTPFKIDNLDIFTSPSIGISIYPEDGSNPESLIKHADFAMYQAKAAGRNQFRFYSLHEYESDVHPLKLEMELHKAIEREELILHYQPKVSLKTGKMIGLEALIRWEHPQLGRISPGNFIPIAEESGLIVPIGEWALYTACKQNKEWHEQGYSFIVSVNLSARQFTQSNLVKSVSDILGKTDLDPQYLELEITESITADIERTILTLQKLKGLGVKISIDDFGTGFSSLNYLKQFPVDTLKIDQSFVRELHNNPNDEIIVKTIISMAHNLNLSVVAEGIETKEQLVFLQQHLCDEGQGYFFTRPIPAEKIIDCIHEIQKMVKEHGISDDINERMWSEQLIRMARKELNDTIRLQQGLIFKFKEVKKQFIHTLCDGELLYRLGFIPSQIVGKPLGDFYPEDMAKSKQVYYQRAWNGEDRVSYESEYNGIYFITHLSPIRRGGEVVEVIGSCVDITDRIIAEQALIESETKYRLIADHMTDSIALLDTDGKVVYASPSHETLLEYDPISMIGRNAFDFISPEDLSFVEAQFNELIQKRIPINLEMNLVRKSGSMFLFECFGSPIIGEDGQIENLLIVGRDITEKKKSEELLWNSEKLSLVGELAAGVAHEIRNPITAIKGFIQLFQQGFIKDEYFPVILTEFNRVEDIIKEFLSLAKPQEIQLREVNMSIIAKDVVTLLESEANLRNVQFSVEIGSELPPIKCDANQIKQVLINLCKNSMDAIESNSEGLIRIMIFCETDHLVINVIDNGIGINEERLKRLGEPFYSNKEKGTGLGLMLCLRIIREHHGTMAFDSKENEGTKVKISLPL